MSDPTLTRDTEIFFLMLAVFYHHNDDEHDEPDDHHTNAYAEVPGFDACPAKICTDHRAILARLRAEKGEA